MAYEQDQAQKNFFSVDSAARRLQLAIGKNHGEQPLDGECASAWKGLVHAVKSQNYWQHFHHGKCTRVCCLGWKGWFGFIGSTYEMDCDS